MKKSLLFILLLTTICTSIQAQDSTAFVASQKEFNPPYPASYASVQTLNGSNLRITGDWTIEAWVKIGISSLNIHIVETYSSGNTGGFVLRIENSKVKAFQITNASTSSSVAGSTTIPTGEWHHIAATLNESTQKLTVYLDGKLDGSVATTLKTKNTNVGLYIGARGDDRKVSGIVQIDDIKIWNLAKTPAQIIADTLACFTGNETGLLAWYDFEKITSNALIDKSTNGNTGNLVDPNFTNRIYTCSTYPLAMKEVQNTNVNIYPNPAVSEVTIDTEEQIKSIQIYDIYGSVVQEETKSSFSIEKLATGIYIAQVQTFTGLAQVRFVKE